MEAAQDAAPAKRAKPPLPKGTAGSWALPALALTGCTAGLAYLTFWTTMWVAFGDPGPFPGRGFGTAGPLAVVMLWVVVAMLALITVFFWMACFRLLREKPPST